MSIGGSTCLFGRITCTGFFVLQIICYKNGSKPVAAQISLPSSLLPEAIKKLSVSLSEATEMSVVSTPQDSLLYFIGPWMNASSKPTSVKATILPHHIRRSYKRYPYIRIQKISTPSCSYFTPKCQKCFYSDLLEQCHEPRSKLVA